jgi:PAS domain S-box-containing protein
MSQTPNRLRILLLSEHDACRGPIAKGLLESLGRPDITAESVGIEARPVAAEAVRVMNEVGIDVSRHVSRTAAQLGSVTFDLVVTLGDRAREWCRAARETATGGASGAADDPRPRHPLFGEVPLRLHWSIPDPLAAGEAGGVEAACRATRDLLREHVSALLGHGYLGALARERDRQARLLDSLDEGIVVHDAFRRIYLFNRAAERITGLTRAEVLGRDCHAVFAPDGLCGQQCASCRGSELPHERCEYQTTFTRADGGERRLRVVLNPVVLDDAGAPGVIASLRDDTEVAELRQRLHTSRSFHGMVGVSRPMQEIFETIRQAAAADFPVLIGGESGTGKELVANAIHNESRRQGGPFVPVSCGALPETILESELFGHVRGAFTGAIRDKKGRFELADGGTLFLDEVGELSPAMQVKLLRVLQEKRFEKVGGERTIQVEVRIIAATNRDLRAMVQAGTFREDLYYRLAVVPLELPPLRDRREDIPHLVEQILADVRREYGKAIARVADDAMDRLLGYPWPGNVRELINAMQSASVRCTSDVIQLAHLPPEVRQAGGPGFRGPLPRAGVVPTAFHEGGLRRACKLDTDLVTEALQRAGGNKVKAAKLLGVGRATLYRFLKARPGS